GARGGSFGCLPWLSLLRAQGAPRAALAGRAFDRRISMAAGVLARGRAAEPEELRGPMSRAVLERPGGRYQSRRDHPAPERVLVERAAEDGLVHALKLREREAR